MNHQQKLERISELFAAIDAVHAQLDALRPTLNPDPGCALYDAIYALEHQAICSTAYAVGDSGDWLDWMIHENACGRKGYEAGYINALKPIRTADDILELIEEETER